MITSENCTRKFDELLKNPSGEINHQAASWRVVAEMCFERGLEWDQSQENMTGLQRVVNYLEKHLPSK